MSHGDNTPHQPPLHTLDDCQQHYLQRASATQQAQARARVLRDYDILDSPPEEAFDKITRLAAHTFHVPISLITFIDAERQWFKSHHGTDLHETDLSASFCLCAVRDGCTLVVPNALEDSRFFNNPSVTGGLELRYYVGAPLITPEGIALGSLCLIDTASRPRPSAEQIDMLETLASMVVDEMRLRRSLREQQHTETQLQKLVRDKTTLLKETHHRVKNNLQLVSSMLSMHSRKLSDSDAQATLRESRDRIAVIAQVHEMMYASQLPHNHPEVAGGTYALPEDHVDLAPLLSNLANSIMRLATRPVALELDLDPVHLDIHRAVPLSLIVNELLTNALKYAFVNAPTKTPTIQLQTHVTAPDTLHLTVADNGVGLPAGTDLSQAASLGFTVVQTLSQQIGAQLNWHDHTPRGLAVSIVLPLT
jgi:two-component sensor histidine kinase